MRKVSCLAAVFGLLFAGSVFAADKITIVGFSAGAHLAASTALLWDAAPVQQALGITGTEARPNAVVLGYPVITSGKLPTAALLRTCAAQMKPCCRP